MPVPVNIITGALGAGKTTAIARLLAAKPAAEQWVVILNEFTDAGVDALTLAMAATGAYDVRAIPGGCLCCTGEEDFQRQLRNLLREQKPARILIEPSGIGHPGAVVEELRDYERAGELKLKSTIALIDPQRLDALEAQDGIERDQIDAADVVLLSKAELADHAERERFSSAAQQLFPAKRWIGLSERGELPPIALDPPAAAYSFEMPLRPPLHLVEHLQRSSGQAAHQHALQSSRTFKFGRHTIEARTQALLGRVACGWSIPAEVIFAREPLRAELARGDHVLFAQVERFKAVLRTGMEQRLLLQKHLNTVSETESAWRQDSRIEVQLRPGLEADWEIWDRFWLRWME